MAKPLRSAREAIDLQKQSRSTAGKLTSPANRKTKKQREQSATPFCCLVQEKNLWAKTERQVGRQLIRNHARLKGPASTDRQSGSRERLQLDADLSLGRSDAASREAGRRFLELPPGPNDVPSESSGSELSHKGKWPARHGRAGNDLALTSHGCIRLSNWDALDLSSQKCCPACT